MSSKDETRCDVGQRSDGYANEPVVEFAENLTALFTQATNAGVDFEKIDFMSFMSPLLVELDGAVSGLLEEREGETSQWRTAAVNYRSDLGESIRRGKRQQIDLPANAKADFARQILPVADAVEAAIDSVSEADEVIVSGIKSIGGAFAEAFRSQGIVKIEAMHRPFDLTYHESIATVESNEFPADTVIDVVRNGFVDETTGKVIRAAQVVISKPPHVDFSEAIRQWT